MAIIMEWFHKFFARVRHLGGILGEKQSVSVKAVTKDFKPGDAIILFRQKGSFKNGDPTIK